MMVRMNELPPLVRELLVVTSCQESKNSLSLIVGHAPVAGRIPKRIQATKIELDAFKAKEDTKLGEHGTRAES